MERDDGLDRCKHQMIRRACGFCLEARAAHSQQTAKQAAARKMADIRYNARGGRIRFKRSGLPWTQEEDELISEPLPIYTLVVCLGRTSGAISVRRNMLRLSGEYKVHCNRAQCSCSKPCGCHHTGTHLGGSLWRNQS